MFRLNFWLHPPIYLGTDVEIDLNQFYAKGF